MATKAQLQAQVKAYKAAIDLASENNKELLAQVEHLTQTVVQQKAAMQELTDKTVMQENQIKHGVTLQNDLAQAQREVSSRTEAIESVAHAKRVIEGALEKRDKDNALFKRLLARLLDDLDEKTKEERY